MHVFSELTQQTNQMSDQDTHREREVALVISDVVVKRFHKCPFSVEIGHKFTATKKRGDRGNAFLGLTDLSLNIKHCTFCNARFKSYPARTFCGWFLLFTPSLEHDFYGND